jgi:acetolactate synthase I/II/III large subunit
MIKLSDYIVKRLAEHGVRHVFMVTGGGAMHLNDSFGKDPRIQFICNHHEQACGMAAEGYARMSGTIGAVCVTTGPGGTNALTGVLGQWLDSIPAIYISGQVRTEVMVAPTGLRLRQLGDQEGDIIPVVRPLTKYAVCVMDPSTIRYHLEKALFLAESGRPGPVWLDVPLDVQGAMIDEKALQGYDPAEDRIVFDPEDVQRWVFDAIDRIRNAERPVLLAGAGIRLAGAQDLFRTVAAKLRIPVLVAWDSIDVIPSDDPYCFGRPGACGHRGANFIFQNSDLLLSIGCRLSLRQTGYAFPAVARAAYKIVVDIDPAELAKPTIFPDAKVCCDAKVFLEGIDRRLHGDGLPVKTDWLAWCKARVDRYPIVAPERRHASGRVDPYVFCDVLSDCLAGDDDVVVCTNGASCMVGSQALHFRARQRHIVNSGCASMGYGLPAAIGACFARDKRPVVCLEGDGSIQMNIQELQTIVHHQLPIKLFMFNNEGYGSIRATQNAFFNSHFVGESSRSGVSFPDMKKIAEAYGIPAVCIKSHERLAEQIRNVLNAPGPILCEVQAIVEQTFEPRVTSRRLPDGRMVSSPLEEMHPALDREEFLSNMIIPPYEPEG